MKQRADDEILEIFLRRFQGIETFVRKPVRLEPQDRSSNHATRFVASDGLLAAGVGVALVIAVILGTRSASAPASSTILPSVNAPTSSVPSAASRSTVGLEAMQACGATLPQQIPVLGSFTALNGGDLYAAISTLESASELRSATGPIDVILFGPGDFLYPVPNMTVPGSGNANHVGSMLCAYHGGQASFYPNVDLGGFAGSTQH
jgi:hypothetical protein